jgi:hypothetical protein
VTQIDVFVDPHGNALAALFQDQVFGADAGNQRLASRYVNAVRQLGWNGVDQDEPLHGSSAYSATENANACVRSVQATEGAFYTIFD